MDNLIATTLSSNYLTADTAPLNLATQNDNASLAILLILGIAALISQRRLQKRLNTSGDI